MTGEEIILERIQYATGDIQGNSDYDDLFYEWQIKLIADELLDTSIEALAEKFIKYYNEKHG